MTLKKLDNGEVSIEANLSAAMLKEEFDKILTAATAEAEMPGFRKGKAPQKMVLETLGEARLLDEAALHLIEDAYPDLVKENDIKPVSPPKVEIMKLALGNPLEFRITVSVLPEFEVPDYKTLAKEVNKKEIPAEELVASDKEVDDVLLEIRKANQPKEDKDASKEPVELTDEDAKRITGLQTLSELKTRIKENISKEKEVRAKNKKRAEIIDKLLSSTSLDVPEVLIQSELNKMFAQFSSDVERMGRKVEDYLKDIKKSQDELLKEWRVDAEKSAKLQLLIDKVAVKEGLQLDEEKVKREVEHLLAHYKDADPSRVRTYVETILMNEQVFELLEKEN